MNKNTQRLFDEHKKPSHCCTRDVEDMMLPIFQGITQAQRQVSQYRELLLTARYSEGGLELAGKFNRLRQKIEVMQGALSEMLRAGERATVAFSEWDTVMKEDEEVIGSYYRDKAQNAQPEPTGVVTGEVETDGAGKAGANGEAAV
jgi:hypothetical protein